MRLAEFNPEAADEFKVVTSRDGGGTYGGHYWAVGTVVEFLEYDEDGDAIFVGPDPVSSAPLKQTLGLDDIVPATN